jgi:hypothetical protein
MDGVGLGSRRPTGAAALAEHLADVGEGSGSGLLSHDRVHRTPGPKLAEREVNHELAVDEGQRVVHEAVPSSSCRLASLTAEEPTSLLGGQSPALVRVHHVS